jgi:hypothetical protein
VKRLTNPENPLPEEFSGGILNIDIDASGTKVWLNMDGRCAVRINAEAIVVSDSRPKKVKELAQAYEPKPELFAEYTEEVSKVVWADVDKAD